MSTSTDSPIHLTICDTASEARALVNELQTAGFTHEEISVVCSQEACQKEFADYIHEQPAGAQTNEALNHSGIAALGLGAAAVLAGVLTTGGTAIIAIGALSGVALAGTFASTMMTRGAEKELADFYDQAVTHGKILVAIETDDLDRRKIADELIQRHGPETSIPRETVVNRHETE